MKKLFFLVFIICSLGLAFQGCEKDENKGKQYRLKAWFDPTTGDRVDITYEADLVKEMKITREMASWKIEWEYFGDSIKLRHWSITDSGWVSVDKYNHLLKVDDDGKLLEHYFIDDGENTTYSKFEWTGDKLKTQTSYINGHCRDSMNFTYSGDKIIRMDYDYDYEGYEEIIYDNDKPVEMKYIMGDELIWSIVFTYTFNQVSSIKTNYGSNHERYETYTYDENNNLHTRSYSMSPTMMYARTIEFEYEEGRGNLDLYWLSHYGRLATYFRPNMIPSKIAVGTWELTSECDWLLF